MRVIYDFGDFRVINTGEHPAEVDSDIILQKKMKESWVRVIGYNSLSNDYAYTAARDYAEQLSRRSAQTSCQR